MDNDKQSDQVQIESVQTESDPLAHPWIDEMRQYESTNETIREVEEWF